MALHSPKPATDPASTLTTSLVQVSKRCQRFSNGLLSRALTRRSTTCSTRIGRPRCGGDNVDRQLLATLEHIDPRVQTRLGAEPADASVEHIRIQADRHGDDGRVTPGDRRVRGRGYVPLGEVPVQHSAFARAPPRAVRYRPSDGDAVPADV